jgi:PKHD-type hydroxylase
MYYILNAVENYNPVLSVDNFFTEEELDKIILQLSNIKTAAAITGLQYEDITNEETFLKAMEDSHEGRKSNIYWLTKPEYTWIYDKITVAINHVNTINYNKVLYGIEPLQYTEYDSKYNGFYSIHMDNYNDRNPIQRSLSFSVQLSREEEYTGGEVVIYHNDTRSVANKKYGTITFFDSKLLHEVTPVISGFRKSLVGWIQGPRV